MSNNQLPEPPRGMKWEHVEIHEQHELLPSDIVEWSGWQPVGESLPGGESFKRGVAVGKGFVYRLVNDPLVDTMDKALADAWKITTTSDAFRIFSRIQTLHDSGEY